MSKETGILASKKQLELVLGSEKLQYYFSLLARVYSFKSDRIAAEEFHEKVRPLFPTEKIRVHNEFFHMILSTCDMLSPVPPLNNLPDKNLRSSLEKIYGSSSKRRRFSVGEEEADSDNKPYMPKGPPKRTLHRPILLEGHVPVVASLRENKNDTSQRSYSNLSDVAIVHGRVLIAALDYGLGLADEEPVKLLFHAVRNQLKTILMATLSRRSAYKIRENKFQYAVGCPPVNIYLSNAHKFTHDLQYSLGVVPTEEDDQPNGGYIFGPTAAWSDAQTAVQLACDSNPIQPRSPVSAWELFDALQVHRDAIPNHSVYARSVECVIAKLHHPSADEIEIRTLQEKMTTQREHIKAQQEIKKKLEFIKNEQCEWTSYLDQTNRQ